MKHILILDDEKNICVSLAYALEDSYRVTWALEPGEGLELISAGGTDLVLLDLKLGRHDGLKVLKEIKARERKLPVIMMTGYGSIDSSVEAIKAGAFHYVSKPVVLEELKNLIIKALNQAGLSRRVEELSRQIGEKQETVPIIGSSPAIQRVLTMVDKVKDIDSNILILGESGTGKDLVAQAIHYRGQRREYRYEAVNCSAIPVNLLESEFFGHKKGAFTGADRDRQGKFEICHKGTLFLDEIGDMDPMIQAKLLRVMQDKAITPLGTNKMIQADVRLIAATNRDLRQAVEQGTFREDLFYRLNVITIEVPPLRRRSEDIPLLLRYFLQKYNRQFNKEVVGARREVLRLLEEYDFPGNVRELENIVERAVAFAEGPLLSLEDLPELEKSGEHERGAKAACRLAGRSLTDIEEQAIMDTLSLTRFNRKRAAELLGITERTLRNKLLQYHRDKI
ncbi:MAG: sigma-54 dependent transcriptional regulator [Peptococcaceae bacterium]|nr:sigma-54 dependent transcriptional regulator [Peptococcaceae bacterium]